MVSILFFTHVQESFEMVKQWVQELRVRAPPQIVIALAANKIDLVATRLVTKEMAESYLNDLEAQQKGKRPIHVECSAKTGENVAVLFQETCRKLIQLVDAGIIQ